MSAFVVDREHIRFLVEAARVPYHGRPLRWLVDDQVAELLPTDLESAARVGQMLWTENVRSVQFRYPQDRPENLPGPSDAWPYEYGAHAMSDLRPHPLSVLQACRCYIYQSCEHPEWAASQAKAFVDALESREIDQLLGLHDLPCWQVRDALETAQWRPGS